MKIGNYIFDGPYTVGDVPHGSGVYAVFTNSGRTAVYIGETKNFHDRVTTSHHSYSCWKGWRRGRLEVFIYHLRGGVTYRRSMETELTIVCKPLCSK